MENENYKEGSDYLKTSCFKCRFKPDYESAIPYFKLAADEFHAKGEFKKEIETREKLVKCFKNENSHWEEGNEYEKISKVQLNQLKSPSDSYNSIENSFHSYINDNKYDCAIKALVRLSQNFRDNENIVQTEKALYLAFEGIKKFYHNILLNENSTPQYIIDCFDMYIDILYNGQNYKKGIEVAKKSAELIEKEKKNEKENIGKYYAFQAIGELTEKKDDKYKNTIEKGLKAEVNSNGLSNKVNKLVNLVKENNKNNEKAISSLFFDINKRVPNSITKMLNTFIQDNKNYTESDDNIKLNNNNDKLTDFEEDLK